jgi:hypothetical protein
VCTGRPAVTRAGDVSRCRGGRVGSRHHANNRGWPSESLQRFAGIHLPARSGGSSDRNRRPCIFGGRWSLCSLGANLGRLSSGSHGCDVLCQRPTYRLRKSALYEGHGFSRAVKYRAEAALAAEVRFFTVIPCRLKLGKNRIGPRPGRAGGPNCSSALPSLCENRQRNSRSLHCAALRSG